MAVAFKRGTSTGPSDLNITIRDTMGTLIDPYRLQYAVFDKTTGLEVLMGSPVNIPIRMSTGQFYAQIFIPADCNIGDWVLRWTIQETSTDPVYQSVQEFNVVGDSTIVSFTGDANLDKLIYSLRIILRDNNPDRNYRFRPPASEKFIQGQTQVFGFIWEDEELLEYLYMAIDDFNSRPPVTGIDMGDLWGSMRRWRTAIIIRGAAFACFAISMNWIADEFSIGSKEQLKLRIGSDEEEITLSIGVLFQMLYADAIAQGRMQAVESMQALGLDGITIEPTDQDEDQIISKKYSIADLKKAYSGKNLFIESLNKDGTISWAPIDKVMRHECPGKAIFKITTDLGDVVVTEDHSLFSWDTKEPIEAKNLNVGDTIICNLNGVVNPVGIKTIKLIDNQQYMYDLSVPTNENFFLKSGILAHNSYSISGVSLDIEKSSKYQSMKDEYIAEYDKLVEAAKRSVKIIKGLRQFRYGVGITSALGPLSRPGIQSRRNFIEAGSVGSWS